MSLLPPIRRIPERQQKFAGRDVRAWSQVSPWVASAAAPKVRSRGWSSKYRAVMWASDLVALTATVAVTFLLLFDASTPVRGLSIAYEWFAPLLIAAWLLMLTALESRDREVVGVGLREYQRVLTASLYLFGGIAIVSFWMQAEVSRALFVTTLPIGAAALLLGRWLARRWLVRLRAAGRAMSRTIIVGDAPAVQHIVADLQRHTDVGYLPAAVCTPNGEDTGGVSSELALPHVPYHSLVSAATSTRYDAVIVTEGLPCEQTRGLAWSLENRPIELMFVPRLVDVAGPRVSFRSVEGLSLIHVDLPRFTGGKLVVKRVFDIAFSAFALALLSPLLLVVAILIKFGDGGPVIFRQQRIGRYGEPFTIHKFRTMCLDAELKADALIAANGGTALLFKLEDDPRITKIGKVLRKYSIDELPQFWTALQGGMSVVGPRPQVDREVAEYTDVHHRRLLIKPGITGLWQVNGRSELSLDDAIRLDLRYVENWSLIGDVAIVLKTIGVVLRPNGAY